jgi:biotin carboxylase
MTRQRVALLSHLGYEAYRHDDGSPFLPRDEYDITLFARPRDVAQVTPGQVDRCVAMDIEPTGELAVPLLEVVGDLEFDWVVATQERLLLPAARLREALGVGGPGTGHTLVLRDKATMKRHFSACGIRVPEFTEISEPAEAADLLAKFGRIVIKPLLGSSSIDVHIVGNQNDLAGLQERGLDGLERYEAEEYITGRQFHLDSVVDDGAPVAVSVSRYLDSHEAFPLDGQVRSHTLDYGPELEVLEEFNRAVLACIPWFSGATHLEVFLDDHGVPVFCELAGRPGGAGIDTTFRYRHGLSLFYASILPQLGRPVPTTPARPAAPPATLPATGWSMIYPPSLGRFNGFAAVPQAPWLLQLTSSYRPGDPLRLPRQAKDAVAVASVHGQNAAEVIARLAEVKSELKVSITPE